MGRTSASATRAVRGIAVASALVLTACAHAAGTAGANGSGSDHGALTPAQIAEHATRSIVSIRSPNSLGAGFLVRKDGWIATNLHVVAGANELTVALADGKEFPVVEVLGLDDEHDLAVIRIDTKANLPTLSLGNSEKVRAGDPVVAIGHPLGLEDTVSNGLVSAVRVIDPSLTLLQISAPIAPGSSGGPLFNTAGEVIGVATLVSREGQNLNFGVPVGYLKALLAKADPIPFEKFAAAASMPEVKRKTIHYDVALLKGCGEGDLRLLAEQLDAAVQVGAPLYNQGNFAACYHIYEGASLDAERKLGAACKGPRKALADGRRKAAVLKDPAAQAWAIRDAFDGLFDVIERKLAEK